MLTAAGAMGTVSRYSLTGLVQKIAGSGFPYGTITVNIIGCFTAGLLWSLFEGRISVSNEIRIVVLVGFMGAFTTFSTFILESGELFRSSQFLAAVTNIAAHNIIGLALMYTGVMIGRFV